MYIIEAVIIIRNNVFKLKKKENHLECKFN